MTVVGADKVLQHAGATSHTIWGTGYGHYYPLHYTRKYKEEDNTHCLGRAGHRGSRVCRCLGLCHGHNHWGRVHLCQWPAEPSSHRPRTSRLRTGWSLGQRGSWWRWRTGPRTPWHRPRQSPRQGVVCWVLGVFSCWLECYYDELWLEPVPVCLDTTLLYSMPACANIGHTVPPPVFYTLKIHWAAARPSLPWKISWRFPRMLKCLQAHRWTQDDVCLLNEWTNVRLWISSSVKMLGKQVSIKGSYCMTDARIFSCKN